MDFETYRGRVFVFSLVFVTISVSPRLKDMVKAEGINEFVEGIRTWLDAPIADLDKGYPYHANMPEEMFSSMGSVKNLNLLAPDEVLEEQAERVKQDIMARGRLLRTMTESGAKKACNSTHKVPMPFVMADFIRDAKGRVIEPFDYWRDCVEVYLLKYTKGQSNGWIARNYTFRSSNGGAERYRMGLVKKILEDVEVLIEAAISNQFPPPISKRAKQYTMIN